ncbi:DUF1993 family protein [Qipengyuania flava]|uniref:DUF1993 family protein n=1 Tax=Qipengyuania flava TaxID=192812 RepID=UPI001C6347AE|nr:DUF1993 domain-containing protein [Qipengyuania flava]QYJ07280.1 DUF1993 domain-containing protein [Qipengyuania flava]
MDMKTLLLTTHANMLATLDGLVAKAADHEKAGELLGARLAEDMHPLSTQIRFLANMPGEALERLGLIKFTSREEDPATFEEARALIAEARKRVEEAAALDFPDEDAPLEMKIPNGMTFDLSMQEYVRDWAVAQFYFHTNAAYAILRQAGLSIGKADYVPYMFKYLRQPAG